MTPAVHDLPFSRDTVARRILGCVGVVQVSHLRVPLRSLRAAQVWPREERLVAAHLDLGLKGVGEVGVSLFWAHGRAMVHQKDRDRPCSLWDTVLEI